ncbi:hypothetical protein ANN_26537 [Periplaneta americana]|uniref:Reverse transcriptase n=1 Tax=Periplaneta americana TaxID=6978 RepID=A0ABQ8RYI2_PERAM|nr:hypothetical protein ANN_26537 [Periplaneta americana]
MKSVLRRSQKLGIGCSSVRRILRYDLHYRHGAIIHSARETIEFSMSGCRVISTRVMVTTNGYQESRYLPVIGGFSLGVPFHQTVRRTDLYRSNYSTAYLLPKSYCVNILHRRFGLITFETECLTLSEWIDALKMVGYVAPVRAVPGRSRDGTRCRRCLSEIETLPHILGFCPYSEALRKIRHHAVRSMLAKALKEVGFTVHQEMQGLATQGSVRRIDIIAIKNNSAYILDPTIRFETHADQPHEVDSEKKWIYEPTIPFYKDKYSLSHIDVIGLMVEAREKEFRFHIISFNFFSRLCNDAVSTTRFFDSRLDDKSFFEGFVTSCFLRELPTAHHTEPSVYSQSRKLVVNTNSIELVSIECSRNMFAFSSDERAFNIESYFRTGFCFTYSTPERAANLHGPLHKQAPCSAILHAPFGARHSVTVKAALDIWKLSRLAIDREGRQREREGEEQYERGRKPSEGKNKEAGNKAKANLK